MAERPQRAGTIMENQNGFDLNMAVTNWRAALAGQESIGPDQARELESHLRDAVVVWVDKGLTEEEAFTIETRRLGSPVSLAREFEAEDSLAAWRNRLYWVTIGLLTMLLLTEVTKALAACGSYTIAWQSEEEYVVEGPGRRVVTSLAGIGAPDEVRNFVQVPAQLPLWAALATPVALYFGQRLRARAATNPRSDFYWLTRTRVRTAFLLASLVTLAHLAEVGAHWYGSNFFGFSDGIGVNFNEVALSVSCAWGLAFMAIAMGKMRRPAALRKTAVPA